MNNFMQWLVRNRIFHWTMKVFMALMFVFNGYNTFVEAWRFHVVFVESQDVTILWFHVIYFVVFLTLSIIYWNSYINFGEENFEFALRLERYRIQMLTIELEALREINQRMESILDLVAQDAKEKKLGKQIEEEQNLTLIIPQPNNRLEGIE